MTRLLRLAALIAVCALTGCAQVSEATLADVVQRRAERDAYVSAVVTDARPARQLLVELTDGEETVWTTGFKERPDRGEQIWTAFTGAPVEHELVGLAYPTAGALEAPESGLTRTGAVALLLSALLALGVVVSGGAALLLRPARGRQCGACGARCAEDWVTCAACGKSLPPPETAPPPPIGATVLTPATAQKDGNATAKPPTGADLQAGGAQTVIVPKEQ